MVCATSWHFLRAPCGLLETPEVPSLHALSSCNLIPASGARGERQNWLPASACWRLVLQAGAALLTWNDGCFLKLDGAWEELAVPIRRSAARLGRGCQREELE